MPIDEPSAIYPQHRPPLMASAPARICPALSNALSEPCQHCPDEQRELHAGPRRVMGHEHEERTEEGLVPGQGPVGENHPAQRFPEVPHQYSVVVEHSRDPSRQP